MILGILTKQDIAPLLERVADLEYIVKLMNMDNEIIKTKLDKANQHIDALQKYTNNAGGDITTVKKQIEELKNIIGNS